MSSGHLSLVLSGKKGISPQKAAQVFSTLGLSDDEQRFYLLQVAQQHARSALTKAKAKEALVRVQNQSHFTLTQDAFEVIAGWEHLAILQTLALRAIKTEKTPVSQIKAISNQLKIPTIVARTAIERMLRLELIMESSNGYRVCHDTVLTTDGVPSQALRNFHSQMLKKAIQALEAQSLEERYPNTIVLPVRAEHFALMRKEILSFQKRILRKYGRVVQGDGEQVYVLTQQLFKLTEEK